MYGTLSNARPLEWAWVREQLFSAGTYWAVVPDDGAPHPRPVWGIWDDGTLYLSIGSLVISRRLEAHREIAVHLDSGTDVVIIEGRVVGFSEDRDVLDRYNDKYDWNYTIDEYGPLTAIAVERVIAWRSAGWAGREGFQATGRWRY